MRPYGLASAIVVALVPWLLCEQASAQSAYGLLPAGYLTQESPTVLPQRDPSLDSLMTGAPLSNRLRLEDRPLACDGLGVDSLARLGDRSVPESCDHECVSFSGRQWKLIQTPVLGVNLGGWSQIGYHTSNDAGAGLLTNTGAPANFNNLADRVQLQQQWFYAERIASGGDPIGWGGRIDYLYGTDAPDTQAFGISNSHFDNAWENGGAYGHAMPQLYAEVAVGSLSVKAGRFFSIMGHEVVQATGNFFYSRQFTFYNAQPFTHTGVLSSYRIDDDTLLWNGYAMGWDSGFEDNGDTYIGGVQRRVTDCVRLTYTSAWGRFNDSRGSANFSERGQIHSLVLTSQLTDRLTHVGQTDYLQSHSATGRVERNTFGVTQYLIYALNDRWSLGSRSEWFNFTTSRVRNADLYHQTFGINYTPNSNLTFRPEIRWVWDKERLGVNETSPIDGLPLPSQATFGTDLIFQF